MSVSVYFQAFSEHSFFNLFVELVLFEVISLQFVPSTLTPRESLSDNTSPILWTLALPHNNVNRSISLVPRPSCPSVCRLRTQAFSPQHLLLAVLVLQATNAGALVLQATNAGARRPGYEATDL